MFSSAFQHVDIYLVNIIGLVVGVSLYNTLGQKIEIIGACLAATISISIGLRTYKIEDDKMFKDLFESFNKKYDCKFNEKLNEINDETSIGDEKLIIDYLNFCSEEYLWFKKKKNSSKCLVSMERRNSISFKQETDQINN